MPWACDTGAATEVPGACLPAPHNGRLTLGKPDLWNLRSKTSAFDVKVP